jgi:hypothetical protein
MPNGDREERLLERVLQRLDHPRLEDPGLDLQGEERRVWRELTELAGLLPFALDPVAPRPSLRDEVLSAARRERSGGEPRREPVAVVRPRPASWPRAARAVAAALAAILVALGGVGGWLVGERSVQRDTIAALEGKLAQAAVVQRELDAARAELARMSAVFTSAGMRACPLRPWGEHPVQPVARAAIYFDAEHEQWFLTARDLEPCRQGSSYVLWFMVDGKPVPGGSFRAQEGVPVMLAAQPPPLGAAVGPGAGEVEGSVDTTVAGSHLGPGFPERLSGAFLTLERDPRVEKPTGPPILYGDGAEEML